MNVLNERLTVRASAIALLTAILWGGNSVAIKIGLDAIPPMALAAARFLLGGLTVLVWVLFLRIPLRLEPYERRGLLQLALLFIVQIGSLNMGTHIPLASRSTVFISIYPFFTALFAHYFIPGDRFSPLKLFGMILSFAGVALLFGESIALDDLRYLPGDILVLFSGLLLGARQVYAKRLTQQTQPGKLLLWQAALSVPVFVALSLLLEPLGLDLLDSRTGWAILYQGLVVAGLCFILYTWLLRRYRASGLGVFGFATPPCGVILSHLLLGEPITTGLLAALVLVGIGVTLVNVES